MKISHLKACIVLVAFMTLIALPVFSQNNQTAPAADQAPDADQDKEIAIYGEAQAIDAKGGVISVQYYDYDSDSEKTADIVVAAETKLENAKDLSEVNKGDWVDVTYIVKDGKNAATVITVEKEEVPSPDDEEPETVSSTEN